MHIETVAPKPPTQPETLKEELYTNELPTLDPDHEGVVPFSAAPRNRSGAQLLVTPKAPSLDAAPEDVVTAPKSNQKTTVAIVLLSVLAVLLWALAFR